MKQGPILKHRLQRWRWARAALALAVGLTWYQSTPGGRLAAEQPRRVHVIKAPQPLGQPHLGTRSAAWQEQQRLTPSIESLRRLKRPTPQQQQQLQRLQQQKNRLRRITDHELRLALHNKDSAFDPRPLQIQIRHLRIEAHQAAQRLRE